MNTKDLSKISIVIRMKLKKIVGKQVITWDQKKIADRENRLAPRKIKETTYFLNNYHLINKISYMFHGIGLKISYSSMSHL